MKDALTQEDLNQFQCTVPGCEHGADDGPVYFYGRCHPGAAVMVSYDAGVLILECCECTTVVSRIEVAKG